MTENKFITLQIHGVLHDIYPIGDFENGEMQEIRYYRMSKEGHLVEYPSKFYDLLSRNQERLLREQALSNHLANIEEKIYQNNTDRLQYEFY